MLRDQATPSRAMDGDTLKSTPLFLPVDAPYLLGQWLDPEYDDVAAFEPQLQSHFHDALSCTPIERPGQQTIMGDSIAISDG